MAQANPGESDPKTQAGTRSHQNMNEGEQAKPIEEKHLNDKATGRQAPSANPKRSPEHEPGFEAKHRDDNEEEKKFKQGIERMNKGEQPIEGGTYEQQAEFERKLRERQANMADTELKTDAGSAGDRDEHNVNTKRGRSQGDESKQQVEGLQDDDAQNKSRRAHPAKAKQHMKTAKPRSLKTDRAKVRKHK